MMDCPTKDPIRTALMAARACIQQDRQALADAHTNVDGLDEDGAAGVAEYDEVLRQIEEALGAIDRPAAEAEAAKSEAAENFLRAREWAERCGEAQAEVEALRQALRIAREGYASEAVTGLPVLPQWRERTMALIDTAMLAARPEAPTVALTEEQR